jgi:DNA-binding NtrC family response regulator
MVDKEIHLKEALAEFEKIYIETAASKYRANKSKIAQALGIHRNTLHNRFKALKIRKKKQHSQAKSAKFFSGNFPVIFYN